MLAFALSSAICSASAQDAVSFDIPPQPLAKALYAFSAATGIEVMVDARHAAGRNAPEIKGAMSPREALAALLAGSDLVAREFGPGTVTLAAISRAVMPAIDEQHYFVDIQRAIEQALCTDALTSPGSYRLALKLWVGQSGSVTRAKRLDTTGDASRDNALDDMLPRVSIGKPPPSHLVQPIALVISPSRSGSAVACSAGTLPSRRARNW